MANNSAFIDYQKQIDSIEFSINRMDIIDMKILSDALGLAAQLESNPFRSARIKAMQKQFKTNIYTQNTGKKLIP